MEKKKILYGVFYAISAIGVVLGTVGFVHCVLVPRPNIPLLVTAGVFIAAACVMEKKFGFGEEDER